MLQLLILSMNALSKAMIMRPDDIIEICACEFTDAEIIDCIDIQIFKVQILLNGYSLPPMKRNIAAVAKAPTPRFGSGAFFEKVIEFKSR